MQVDLNAHSSARVHPLDWAWAKASAPSLSSESTPWPGAVLRAWHGTSAVMEQPPLDHHYVVMHLGGAKQVTRRGDGPKVTTAVDSQALTLVPAGSAYLWKTEGPIAFAHLYIPPRRLEQAIESDLGGQGRGATLVDRVGCRDAFIEPLLAQMIGEIGNASSANTLRLDCLFESLCLRLALKHSSQPGLNLAKPVAMAPHRLRRVLDFIDANLGRDISLADLAAAADSSQSHFSRAFQIANGCSPYQYLLRRRIEFAKVLLLTGNLPLDEVSALCGFTARHQFAIMFKRIAGVGPKRFRSLVAGQGSAARSLSGLAHGC